MWRLLGWWVGALIAATFVAHADETKLANASVMGIKLGDTYESVCATGGVADWPGLVGNPRFRDNGTLRTLPPSTKEPYDAQLDPPRGSKYLGGDLVGLNLYFDFEGGKFRLFAVAFQVEGVPLDKVLTRQFGPMTTNSGWASEHTMLLLQDNEVLLFDIKKRNAVEIWYYKNQKDFSPSAKG